MPLSVTTSFLGLCLIVAFQSFHGISDPNVGHWILFLYYVSTKIRYYQGGYQFSRTFPGVIRKGAQIHQVVALQLGIGVRFLFLICASFIDEPASFFAFYAVTLAVNIPYLNMQKRLIDHTRKEAAPVEQILSRWLLLNRFETPIALITSILLRVLPNQEFHIAGLGLFSNTIITATASLMLLAIHILDTLWNRDFLFPEHPDEKELMHEN